MSLTLETRSRWSPSALQTLDGCTRRFALREALWSPKPDPFRPPSPHADFGRIWHKCAEEFDRARFNGETVEQATDYTMGLAVDLTWDDEREQPWAGESCIEWRCVDGKVPSEKTGRPVQCPASKGWWTGRDISAYAGGVGPRGCVRCNGPVEYRRANIPYHKAKNRATLLRAVLDYCDDALPGVAPINGEPGLEIDLEFKLHGHYLHCFLDRYTYLSGTYLAHERKTSSRSLSPDNYFQTFQVRLYPEALRQNGLRCDGVMIEHYQILAGGTQRSTVTLTPGPDQIQEAAQQATALIAAMDSASSGLDPYTFPPRFSHCGVAAGGMPCEYLKICKAAFARRPEILNAEYEQKERV